MTDGFDDALREARQLLTAPQPTTRTWPALLAALAFAVSALALAAAVILSPPVQLTPAALHGSI